MTAELAAQRDMLERERVNLEQLLAPDPNWQALLALDRENSTGSNVLDSRAAHDPAADTANDARVKEQRKKLQAALSNNRIFCARERLIEAIDLIRDELLRGSALEQGFAQSTMAPGSPNLPPPDQAAGSSAATDHKAHLLSQGAKTFRTKINVKIRSTPDVRPGIGTDVGTLPDDTPDADDLTAIRGVDATLAAQLSKIGVRRYRQIANWSVGDVVSVRAALGLGKAISRDNWIEQAALLARTVDANEIAVRPEAATDDPPVVSVETEPRVSVPPGEVAEPDQVARAAQSILARVATSPVDEKPSAAEPDADTEVLQPVAATVIAAAAAAQFLDVAEDAVADEPEAESQPRQQPHQPQQTLLGPPDTLQDMRGVDDALALQLNEAGVTHFSQIAAWTASDVATLSIALSLGSRITRECWVEQAAALLRDDETAFSRHRKTGAPARAGAMIDWSVGPARSPPVEMPIEPVSPPAIDQAVTPWLVGYPEVESDEVEPAELASPAEATPEANAADEVAPTDVPQPPDVQSEVEPGADPAIEERTVFSKVGTSVPDTAPEPDEETEPRDTVASTDADILITTHPAVIPDFLVMPPVSPTVLPAKLPVMLDDNQAAEIDDQVASEPAEIEIVVPTAGEPLAADPPANENSPANDPARALPDSGTPDDTGVTETEKREQADVAAALEQDEADVVIFGGRLETQATSRDEPDYNTGAETPEDQPDPGDQVQRARRSHYSPSANLGGSDDPETDAYSSFRGHVDEASVSIISRTQQNDQIARNGGSGTKTHEEAKPSTVKTPALAAARRFMKTLRGR